MTLDHKAILSTFIHKKNKTNWILAQWGRINFLIGKKLNNRPNSLRKYMCVFQKVLIYNPTKQPG